jgi:predicted chitinase
MADRTVYGLNFSENGWRMVDQGSCVWIKVPGTDDRVSLQIREGQPAAILGAFVADWNAYIEPVRDADSACWTPTNSVASSNHLSGTACDVNWNSHPFRVADAGFNAPQLKTMNEMLDFYENLVFWGNRWTNPKDAMHVQMNGGTYGSENVDKVNDFIRRKIRADGFSTFRRGGAVTPPPPPPSNQVDVLARATGVSATKAQEILVGVVNGLRDSQCNNVNRIAMWLAQIGHESAGFNATEEYDDGDESTDRWKYKGRTWIQITWRSNYAGLSQWAFGKGLIPTPTYFVDNPKKLAEIQYAGLGPAWYWTVARPQINSLCDQRNLVAVTQAINGGQNGATDRKNRYDRALALGDQLLVLTNSAPSTPGDDMAQVPQDQWDRVYRELTQKLPSRSPLRHLGEGLVDTMAGFVLNADGSEHVEVCRLLAGYGHPPTLALLREVAGADPVKYPDRQEDRLIAQAILADVTTAPVATVVNNATVAAPEPQIVYVDRPVAAPAVVEQTSNGQESTGQIIGAAYDALQKLRLADALPIEDRAPLAALISVLSTKNGAAL